MSSLCTVADNTLCGCCFCLILEAYSWYRFLSHWSPFRKPCPSRCLKLWASSLSLATSKSQMLMFLIHFNWFLINIFILFSAQKADQWLCKVIVLLTLRKFKWSNTENTLENTFHLCYVRKKCVFGRHRKASYLPSGWRHYALTFPSRFDVYTC